MSVYLGSHQEKWEVSKETNIRVAWFLLRKNLSYVCVCVCYVPDKTIQTRIHCSQQEYARGQKTVPHGTWKSPPHGSLDDICVFVIDLAAVSSCPFETSGGDFDDHEKKHDTIKRRKERFRRYTFSPEKLTQNGIPISKSTRMPKSKSTKINFPVRVHHRLSSARSAMSKEKRAAALRRVSDLSFDDLSTTCHVAFPPPSS